MNLFVERQTSPEEEERLRHARERAFKDLQVMKKVRIDKYTIKLIKNELKLEKDELPNNMR